MAQRAISVAKFAAEYDTVSALNLTKDVLYGSLRAASRTKSSRRCWGKPHRGRSRSNGFMS